MNTSATNKKGIKNKLVKQEDITTLEQQPVDLKFNDY